ncbi:MAG: helix-turn-helix transcriptional regulator [Planctomycetota bacterium]|jgi:transcriptional regulator with XRE-family HTH domain
MAWNEGLGRNVRRLRKARGYDTQAALATSMGAAERSVAAWERGEREPQGKKLVALLAALDVSKEELFSYDATFEEPPPALVESLGRIRDALDRAETSIGMKRANPMAENVLTLPPRTLPMPLRVAAEDTEAVRVVPVAPERAEDFSFSGVAVAQVVGDSAGDVAWSGQHVLFDPVPVPPSSLALDELVIIANGDGECFFKRRTGKGFASIGSRKAWKHDLNDEVRYYRTRGVIWKTRKR